MALNYKHLKYFHEVTRLGSIQAAADALHVSPQAVSVQIKQLEAQIGQPLLRRYGRRLRPTDAGRVAQSYAGQIFDLGAELLARLSDHPGELALPVRLGVTDSVPKSMTVACIQSAMNSQPNREFIFIEGSLDDLLGDLITQRIHAVLSDREPGTSLAAEVDVRLIVRSPMAWLAAPPLADSGPFPGCLDQAPVILWQASSAMSRQIQTWFRARDLQPRVVARCVDSALMKNLCAAGFGYAPVPLAIADTAREQLGLETVGVMTDVDLSLWLIERPGDPVDCISWPDGAE